MPKRTDIKSILIIGAGPIIIGQGCEFDYSGVQACKSLKEEGYRVILINSNPATIMTDSNICDATYIEPITPEYILKVIARESPDALLATMGGQTALNCALALSKSKLLEKYSVELIGATEQAIYKAEDREQFRTSMKKIGIDVPKAKIANNLETAILAQAEIGFPTIIRPSFTLGGSGGGVAYNLEEFKNICKQGLMLSPTHQLLIEESLLGWKEFELEAVRDSKDNCIIVCAIENIDPMGIHTGDSITVAPAQTLTDKEYQQMRDYAIAVLREIGVETGGANVQFAVDPVTGRMVVIEMNPRVSRSSALASKATGFPIAKIAAKLAVGYTLDELRNDITQGKTPISFEPAIDYVVTKMPRFNFEKFEAVNSRLTTQMKSVGEVMAIGRTFQESLQKAFCSLEIGLSGLMHIQADNLEWELENPGPNRLLFIAEAFRQGFSLETLAEKTHIDPWFLNQIEDLIVTEQTISKSTIQNLTPEILLSFKRKGFSDQYIALLMNIEENTLRELRRRFKIHPVFKRVDSCAAEFKTATAYLYSTYEQVCESNPTKRKKIIVLGSGSNRIGQGIEFDYCCVHAVLALKEVGYETIMVNCNPETVSTDYDISDRLYFEALTLEHILEIVSLEKPMGVIVHMGGQTPLKLAKALAEAGVPLIGTSPDAIDCAEDRLRFSHLLRKLNLKQPNNGIACTIKQGEELAKVLDFPIIVRPSYVLGGRAMKIVYTVEELRHYLTKAVVVSESSPVLLESFLIYGKEVDVDAVSDGKDVFIGGILEHVEYAGIHSGDSTCSLPPYSLSPETQNSLRQQTTLIAKELSVVGPINIQFVIQGNDIFVIEANPRTSRTVPFVSKAIGIPLAKVSALCMVNISLTKQGILQNKPYNSPYFYVKLPVFSFSKFTGIETQLGPEMKSTGEVMGIGRTFMEAFLKTIIGVWPRVIHKSDVYIYVDKPIFPAIKTICKNLLDLGFKIAADFHTVSYLKDQGCLIDELALEHIKISQLSLAIIITEDPEVIRNLSYLRMQCSEKNVNYLTTLLAAQAFIQLQSLQSPDLIGSLQELIIH